MRYRGWVVYRNSELVFITVHVNVHIISFIFGEMISHTYYSEWKSIYTGDGNIIKIKGMYSFVFTF